MERRETEPSAPSLQLGDVYYALFRHKGKILLCAVAGFVAAALMYKLTPPLFQSEIKLLVRYVVDSKTFGPTTGDLKMPDTRGDGIINSEMQILRSFDLAREVLKAVGPEKFEKSLWAGTNSGSTEAAMASVIQSGLKVEAPDRGNVIVVSFSHPDPEVPQNVLGHLADQYFKKHREIHQSPGAMDDFLNRMVDQFRIQVAKTDEDLRVEKSKAKVVSIEETMKAHLSLMARIHDQLLTAEADLAERKATFVRFTNHPPANAAVKDADKPQPPSKVDDYRRVVGQLEFFLRREQELLSQFTPENTLLQQIRLKIAETQAAKTKLEAEDPALLKAVIAASGQSADAGRAEVSEELLRSIAGLEARIQVLTNQLALVQRQATAVEEVENKIRELLRKKEVEETQYRKYADALEQSRLDEAIGPGKLPNISYIQKPTPPRRDSGKLFKKMAIAAFGGVAAGVALAFLIELFLDQTVRRPADVKKSLKLPVFLNIPRLRRMKSGGTLPRKSAKALPAANGAGAKADAELLLQKALLSNTALQPYCDTLRDRLIAFFMKNNMTHKPKLVAVTGCLDSSGVSTVAAGLAASLSETGDGNVLLVDTSDSEGAAHPFYRGKLACGLDDVLNEDKRNDAQLRDNLFVATAAEADGPLLNALPKRFRQLMPKLKASDYDYIIFDMPPVTHTSITGKLAGFMDIVLLVVESEKTGRSIVAQSAELLRESRANVATVLNKTRRYVPQWVHREFE